MTDRLAATAYRLLAPRANAEGTSDHDSLENIITDPLPNGSLCWVIATEGLYRLDKLDNVTPALAGIVIIPLAGPGRWILLSSGSANSQLSAEIFLTAVGLQSPDLPAVISSAGMWAPGPIGEGAIYTSAPVPSPVFISDLLAGTLKYMGPDRRYLLETYATIALPSSSEFVLALTANLFSIVSGMNDRIGFTTNDGTEGIVTSFGGFYLLSAARSVPLTAGDIVRPAITDVGIDGTSVLSPISVRRLHLVATPFE